MLVKLALAVLRPVRNVTDSPYRIERVDAVMSVICHRVMLVQVWLYRHA